MKLVAKVVLVFMPIIACICLLAFLNEKDISFSQYMLLIQKQDFTYLTTMKKRL